MKPLHRTAGLAILIGALTAACHVAPLRGCPPRSSAGADAVDARRPVERFTGDFERGDLSGWSEREAAREDSIQVVTDLVRRGRNAAKFTVRPGEPISNGNRAELLRDNGDRPGSQSWNAWSFFVPLDYPDVEWKPKLWQCLGQWHDQPNLERGETWDNFPGHSPPIAIYYNSKKGVSGIELWYGTYPKDGIQKIIAFSPISKGRWNDLVFHIGWSPDKDGFIEAWLNGQPFTLPLEKQHKVFGANMWNAYPHYLKIGLYRSADIGTTNSVYFDEIRIGNSYREVALPMQKAQSEKAQTEKPPVQGR